MASVGRTVQAVPGDLRVNGAALGGAALFVGLVWGAVQALPHLAWPLVALVWLLVAGPVALAPAWSASVRAGHAARLWRGQGRALLYRGGVRVILAGVVALIATALMLLRLHDAVPILWLLALLAALLPVMLTPFLARRLGGALAGLHALRLALRGAVALSVAFALAVHGVLAWSILPVANPPVGLAMDPQAAPMALSVLVAEGMTLSRLWSGLEGFALGHLAEFGDLGRWSAAALSLAGQAGVYTALALAGATAAIGGAELGRALAPASDAPAPPPPGRAGVVAAVALAMALMLVAGLAERELATTPPADRPAAQVQIAAERIGDVLYRAGTLEQIEALRNVVLAEDAMTRARLDIALDHAFDAMAANVDPFLDGYYTLWADYMRLFAWMTGGLEQHLARQLQAALTDGAPFARLEALRDAELATMAARHADLLAQEAALLTAARLPDHTNPARVRIEQSRPALPEIAGRLQADMDRAATRWAVAGGTGVLAVIVAQRVVTRLAARGVLRGAARALTRVAGLLVAVGVDYALVRLDEVQNRAAFRAEILAEIDRLRVEARSDPPATGQR